jgi:hypothetical protein
MFFSDQIISFYRSLHPPKKLPPGFDLLYPQQSEAVMEVVTLFFQKYYNDETERELIFGINPGRFGAGTTGINFTAPKQLTEFCGIEHGFKMQSELSAEFIYAMIKAYGGPGMFYKKYFISSISPLGFTKNGINVNYYDDPKLYAAVKPFIVESIQQQLTMPFSRAKAFCIGGDKNLKFFTRLNEEFHFFGSIIPLPHPRFIMQYRRKRLEEFIGIYLEALK